MKALCSLCYTGLVVCATVTVASADPEQSPSAEIDTPALPRVRTVDPRVQQAVAEAIHRSLTFRSLIKAFEERAPSCRSSKSHTCMGRWKVAFRVEIGGQERIATFASWSKESCRSTT